MSKSPKTVEALDQMSQALFGIKRTDAIATGKCATCQGDATNFHNDNSRREYQISGMCQKCQDSVFGSSLL